MRKANLTFDFRLHSSCHWYVFDIPFEGVISRCNSKVSFESLKQNEWSKWRVVSFGTLLSAPVIDGIMLAQGITTFSPHGSCQSEEERLPDQLHSGHSFPVILCAKICKYLHEETPAWVFVYLQGRELEVGRFILSNPHTFKLGTQSACS